VQGKTIQIFLPDGNARGVRLAEITSRTVLAIAIPRANLDVAANRPELSSVGIYFLIGDSEEGQPLVYVGEAEDTLARLRQHNKGKDFWSTALAVVSKTQYFTKTHVKYLEWYCHEAIKRAERFQLENSTLPACPFISESMKADLHDNFETIQVLAATLGYPLFDQIRPPARNDVLFCRGKEAEAKGEYTEDGLVVFAGSTANLEEVKSAAGTWVTRIRQPLIDAHILDRAGNVYRFAKNHVFRSPSAAAVAVLGRNANGWTEWKFADGRTLDEVKREGTPQP
jgi:Domain of unknown function (DUF4357)